MNHNDWDLEAVRLCPDCGRKIDIDLELCESCFDSAQSTKSNDSQHPDDPSAVYYTNG